MCKVFIFGGGSIDLDFAREYIKNNLKPEDKIIAADAGLNALYNLKIKPDIILGDFDSADSTYLDFYKKCEGISFKAFPPHKDYTDMELAVGTALEYEPREILIFGGTGTRLDHVIGNIFCLQMAMERGIRAKLIDSHNEICLLSPGSYEYRADELFGKYISFLPYTQKVSGLYLKGFLYPLTDYEMKQGTTLGISNEAISERVFISFKEGVLIFIQSKD